MFHTCTHIYGIYDEQSEYACVLEIYAKFEVNRFNSPPGILHADFENMSFRKMCLKLQVHT